MSPLNTAHFESTGKEAARAQWEAFSRALVRATSENVRGVRPAPGDWGIDVFVGDIDDSILVWQAKYFPDGLENSQKKQIRESYASAKAAAKDEEYEILSWTLVIPCELSGPEHRWWSKFKRDRESDGIAIELWELTEIEGRLRSPEASDVRAEYFPALPTVHEPTPPPVRELPEDSDYGDSLFIKQLRYAGHTEIRSALEQFYNAEVLERDFADKGLEQRSEALNGYRTDLHGMWSDRFESHSASEPSDSPRLPQLHSDVMGRIDSEHLAAPMNPFPLTRTHRKGFVHQLVERGTAGWTRDYEQRVEEHEGNE